MARFPAASSTRKQASLLSLCCTLLLPLSNCLTVLVFNPCPEPPPNLSLLSLVALLPQGEADSALDIMWRKKVTDGQAA
jgi:hypothetical protein